MKLVRLIFRIIFLIPTISYGKVITDIIRTSPRIIGGTEVTVDGFAPYQVSIQTIYSVPMCGGAIIDKKWIITAANCVAGWSKNYIKIITGTNNRLQPNAEYYIDDIVIHPYHNNPMYFNDIALLRVNKTIAFNRKTQPILIDDYDDLVEGDQLIVTGWGSTKLWGEASEQLKKLEMAYVPHKKCKSKLKSDGKNVDPLGHLCTFSKKNEGTCYMDAGDPVVRNGILVGLVNWGKPCALGFPDVNCRVSYYSYWIKTVLRK